jgi:predicted CXXCH cytochrome family protein
MSVLRRLIFLAAAIGLASTPSLAQEGNPHNVKLCLVCHKETPKFGVDTKATVTFRAGGWDDPALCATCHKAEENLHPLLVAPGDAKVGTRTPSVLPLGTSPAFAGKVVCTTCHFIHAADTQHALLRGFPGSQEPGRFAKWQDFCRDCHGEGLAKRSPHAGDDRACAFCHGQKPQAGKAAEVLGRGADLCNFCHGGVQNGHYEKANPFAGEVKCSSCHDPHLGPQSAARLNKAYLDAARDAVVVSPHYRARALCSSCHVETGDRTALRLPDPVSLCNRCHGTGEIVGDIHPIRKVPDEIKPPAGWPLQKGFLTCLTCHTAGHREHAKDWKFLRGGPYGDRNDFCRNCHTPESFKGRNPHLDINEGKGCEFCHAVRPVPGKDTIETVRFIADPNILCLRCHAESAHPANFEHTMVIEPARAAGIPKELPVYRGTKIVCATCHNPHIAEVENQKLRMDVGGVMICAACHKI